MVARAVAQEPSLLVLDEPQITDIKQQLEVLNLIRDLSNYYNFITRLKYVFSVCDEVLLLNHGYSLDLELLKIFSENYFRCFQR